ncbi:26S proteasome regulatory subunit Rpn7/COP9 signalosome complex subunit 1 protein [Raphanus sativus]|nr:26S proteasome regulatory subunit Rpn7/COP9 signalosome complex subunit 1 protein [Raphanus sativus]
MDLLSYTLQVAFFYMDFDLVSKSIDKAKKLFEEGGDWERKNRLKLDAPVQGVSPHLVVDAPEIFLTLLELRLLVYSLSFGASTHIPVHFCWEAHCKIDKVAGVLRQTIQMQIMHFTRQQ